MRLAFAIEHFNPQVGGAEGFAAMLTRRLAQKGHEVHVLAEKAKSGKAEDVEVHESAFVEMPQKLKSIAPDATIDWGLNIPADLHRLGGGVHREFLRYNRLSACPPLRSLKWLEHRVSNKHNRIIRHERALLERPTDHILAVSTFVADQVKRVMPAVGNRLHVLHNGVDTTRFQPVDQTKRQELRKHLGVPVDAAICLFVGHNLRLKNLALLLRVFPEIHAVNPAARLVVFGKRTPKTAAPWLLHIPASDHPEAVYAIADLLLHPTYFDACANVVLEALACGVPVLSSDLNGSAELLADADVGEVLPVHPESVACRCWTTHVLDLLNDPERRHRMAQNARQQALENDVSTYVDCFENLLERLISR